MTEGDLWLERALEFERQYAARSGITVQHLRDIGRTIAPCHCGAPECPGWQSLSRKRWREDPLYRLRNGGEFEWPPLDERKEEHREAERHQIDTPESNVEGGEQLDHERDDHEDRR